VSTMVEVKYKSSSPFNSLYTKASYLHGTAPPQPRHQLREGVRNKASAA
jgi:hypothetical protein